MRRLAVASSILGLLLAGFAVPALAGIDARLMRHPDVSATQICFVYAGDLWVAPKGGGQAARLSTPPGEESFPRFSPDGKWIAYSANYDGNTDVYVIAASGGVPTRLTYHPMVDRLIDWYPDGRSILFASAMESGKQRFSQLYRVSRDGGMPERLPLPYGEFGSIAPDGKTLAYMPLTRDFRTWKRYRGGMTTDIWIFDLGSLASEIVPTENSNDTQPMWHGGRLYFQSDRGEPKRANLWVYDRASREVRQLTRFTDYDVRFPAIGPEEIVFEQGGRLHLYDLAADRTREVAIEVVTDRATLKPQRKNVSKFLQGATISPSGKRALVQARGEVFTLPAEHGPVVNLTNTSGAAERFPRWSPDGKEIAYWSDRSGEYELTVRPADGGGEEKTLTKLGPGFRYAPTWSPDGKRLVFIDQAMRIHLVDRATGAAEAIDRAFYMFEGGLRNFSVSWSPDSRWIAYDRDLERGSRAVFLYDTRDKKLHQVTAGFYGEQFPSFDPKGEHLYFLANRHFDPSYSDFDNTWIYANSTRIFAVPLRRDVASPLAARNDAEGKDEKKGENEKKGEEKKSEETKEPPKPVTIDLDGFERRAVALPPKAGNYGRVVGLDGKILFSRLPNTGSDEKKGSLAFYDLEKREEKTVLAGIDGFTVSADGKKVLVAVDGKLAILEVGPDQKFEKPLRTEELSAEIDPAAEWRQIFQDAWRFERDYFYDPNLHGVDWEEMRRRYGKLLEDAVTRWDVNFVLGELIAELNASHTYRGGGDEEQPPQLGVGLLGADYEWVDGAYRIARILDGAAWDSEVRSPLAEPGLGVEPGDFLLAVNGQPVDVKKPVWAAFAGLAKTTVELTLHKKPTLEGARKVLVTTLDDETRLRNLAWIESNRKKVEEATGGRVGYLYVPSTGIDGQTELMRMFMGQFDKPALIVDERFNNGGQIPDRFVELLNRPVTNYWAVRDGRDWQWPPVAHHGPKVMLINEWSGSGGDCFPLYFKQAGLGPLVGTRTWGGLIGISGAPELIDNGAVTVPTFGIYSTAGEWIVENHGVEPDIEVDDDPTAMAKGGDPQLERAIAEALRLLDENPPKRPKKPAYPDRSN